jgi:hypothetical protein
MLVPPSTPATYLNLSIDASSNGGDSIDVISSNSQLPISLVLPSGVEVTPANASGLGFKVLQQVVSSTDGSISGGFTPFDAIGAHTTFILPGSSPGGVYQVKANSTSISTSTNVTATYISLSGVQVGIAKNQPVYNAGGTAVLTVFVFSGSNPVTGATINATVVPPLSLNAQTADSNFQIVNQTTNSGFTQYTYQASLVNSGGAQLSAVAKLINVPSGVTLIDAGTLGFANAPANGTTTSVNTFTIQVPSGQTFDPTTLSWDISALGTPATVSIVDSGPYDFATGDGLYTGVFTPATIGPHQVLVDITGTFGGAQFSRTISTSLLVVNPTATFSGVTDSAVDDNGDGLTEDITSFTNR